jgi:hypothetical protein
MYILIASDGYGDVEVIEISSERAQSNDWFDGWDNYDSSTLQVNIWRVGGGKPQWIKGETNDETGTDWS